MRVLVPTYKETLDIVAKTVHAAYNAPLPVGCMRTIYVLDDGKDSSKRRWYDGHPHTAVPLLQAPILTESVVCRCLGHQRAADAMSSPPKPDIHAPNERRSDLSWSHQLVQAQV